MINAFIAIIISFFVWRKSSQEVKTKIRNANGYITTIFAIISFVLVVFYLKTYQVATISNSVDIKSWQYGVNEDGTNCDTINELTIMTRFNSSALLTPLFDRRSDRIKLQVDSFLEKRGGLYIKMQHSNHPSTIKRRNEIPDNIYEQLGIEVPNNGQLTSVSFITTEIPMLFPIKSYHLHDSISPNYSEHGFEISKHFITRNQNLISRDNEFLEINNGYFDQTLYGTYNIHEIKEKYFTHSYAVTDRHANSLDIFTAADISQVTYQLLLKSDYFIKDLNIDCNIPIEIIGTDSSIITNTYGLKITDANSHMGRGRLYTYHILLPTFNNLQLIRSLVLTTLITTFLSLFFANLYYWIRKKTEKRYLKNKLSFKQWRILLKIVNKQKITLFILFILLLVISSILVLNDYPILIPEHQTTRIAKIIIITTIISVLGTISYIAYAIKKDYFKSKSQKYYHWIIAHCNKKIIIFLLVIALPSCAFIIWNQHKPLNAEDYYKKACEYRNLSENDMCNITGREILNAYKKAANAGSINAQYDLGCFYLNGGITPVDYNKSHEYFLKSAEQGHTESQYRVAMNYYYGKGTDNDVKEAFKWWEKAAENGHAESQYEAGLCLLNGELGYTDEKKAFVFLLEAAQKNMPQAQCLVGQCYFNGWGVEQNRDEGIRWFQIASKNNDENAIKYLKEIEEDS